MDQDVKTVVEPSSTTAVADGWDANGTPIVTPKPEPPKHEEPAASEPPTSKAKPEKHAESGTAKQEPKPKAKPSAEERIAELIAERNADRKHAAELAERLRNLETAAKPPAKAEPAKPPEPPKRPRMSEYLTNGVLDSEKYEAAMDKYEQDREQLRESTERQKNAIIEQGRLIDKWKSDLKGKYSEKADAIDVKATVDKLVSTIKEAPAVAAFINDSESFTDLLYVLGTDPKLDDFIELAKGNPTKAIRRLVAIEAGVQEALSKPAISPKLEDKPKVETPEPKPRAPKPPSEVGGRGASTEDAAIAAAKDGNFRDFDTEQKRRYYRAS